MDHLVLRSGLGRLTEEFLEVKLRNYGVQFILPTPKLSPGFGPSFWAHLIPYRGFDSEQIVVRQRHRRAYVFAVTDAHADLLGGARRDCGRHRARFGLDGHPVADGLAAPERVRPYSRSRSSR